MGSCCRVSIFHKHYIGMMNKYYSIAIMDHSKFDCVLARPRLSCTSCKANSSECIIHPEFKDVLRTSLVNFKVRIVGRAIWVKTLLRERIFCPASCICAQVIFFLQFLIGKIIFLTHFKLFFVIQCLVTSVKTFYFFLKQGICTSCRTVFATGCETQHLTIFVGIQSSDLVSTKENLTTGLSSKILSDSLSANIDEGILPLMYSYQKQFSQN